MTGCQSENNDEIKISKKIPIKNFQQLDNKGEAKIIFSTNNPQNFSLIFMNYELQKLQNLSALTENKNMSNNVFNILPQSRL